MPVYPSGKMKSIFSRSVETNNIVNKFLNLSCICFALLVNVDSKAQSQSHADIKRAMKDVTQTMLDEFSYQGGFVWFYLPDLSRQWGELEAKRTMVWLQPPGTATVGHVLLDAYHATGDEYYYRSAQQVVQTIIQVQHPSGGWNYVADLAGEESLKQWYATVGKNAWRLEEFQHYYGNATFDDGGTSEAATLLLRIYLEKRDPQYYAALNRAIEFVLNSQYPIGGWPQRYPYVAAPLKNGTSEYPAFITFNDDVLAGNIEFLLRCYQTLGDIRFRDPIIRAMNLFLVTQQGSKQPGWALQYTTELEPVGARSYEPKSLSVPTSVDNIEMLIKFYRLTGDSKFLARIPEAIKWLESLKLADTRLTEGRDFPSFIELGSGKPLYTHRRGSNIYNGQYFVDNNPINMLAHYKSAGHIDIEKLKAAYEEAEKLTPDELAKTAIFKQSSQVELPKYFTLRGVNNSDFNLKEQRRHNDFRDINQDEVSRLIAEAKTKKMWLTPLYMTSNPYIGDAPTGKTEKNTKDYALTMVGDKWDTSPYPAQNPQLGISTGVYVENMGLLINYLHNNSK
jgi:PelA/Pel-15E family pectate lyase